MDNSVEVGAPAVSSSSQELTGVIGNDGFLRDTNHEWGAVLAWTPEELRAINFIDLVHPADADATLATLASLAAGNQSVGITNALISRSGVHHWFEWTFVPVDGGAYSVGRPVTSDADRKTALIARERRIHSGLVVDPIGIITTDVRGIVTSFSATAERVFGYEADEVLGQNVKMLMPQPYRDDHDAYIAQYAETGVTAVLGTTRDVVGLRKLGTTFPMRLAVHETSIGGQSAFFGAVQDLTGAINAQSEKQAALVARQAALIARQAALAAVASNVAKDDFLSRMSHELRTPLNAILGFAQLAEFDAETSQQKENAQIIATAGRHLLTLINDVLDISLIDAGQLRISLETVSVGEVVTECLAFMGPEVSKRRLNVTKLIGAEIFVQADKQRFRQVVLNLLSNAVKYSFEDGEITLEVTGTVGGMARIAVIDSGPGLHPGASERIFQSFERLDQARSASEGTGLGLAVASALMKSMGGTIGLESKLGDGSTFWIELAMTDAQTADVKSRRCAEQDAALRAVPRTLLYVEDNAPNIRLMERVLENRPSIKLVMVHNGAAGLAVAESHQPDFVFLDLHLPDMHGTQVLAQLKSSSTTRSIPVVIVTADANPDNASRLEQAGAHGLLTKPIDVDVVLELLDGLVAAADLDESQ